MLQNILPGSNPPDTFVYVYLRYYICLNLPKFSSKLRDVCFDQFLRLKTTFFIMRFVQVLFTHII